MSASLCPAKWHMQNMQTSEFLHLLGHFRVPLITGTSSKGDGTTRRFRGYFYGGVFSLGLGGGCGVSFSSFPSSFSISSTCQVGHFESHISNFSSKFCKFRSPTAGRYISFFACSCRPQIMKPYHDQKRFDLMIG